MAEYFVSWAHEKGFGSGAVSGVEQITSYEQLKELEKEISKQFNNKVIILNYSLLNKEDCDVTDEKNMITIHTSDNAYEQFVVAEECCEESSERNSREEYAEFKILMILAAFALVLCFYLFNEFL